MENELSYAVVIQFYLKSISTEKWGRRIIPDAESALCERCFLPCTAQSEQKRAKDTGGIIIAILLRGNIDIQLLTATFEA